MRYLHRALAAALVAVAALLFVSSAAAQNTARSSPVVQTATLSVWNSGTSLNATQSIYAPGDAGFDSVLVHVVQSAGSFSAGAITFEVSYDNSNWVTIPADAVHDPSSTTWATIALPYTLVTSTNKPFLLHTKGWQAVRIKLSTAITGTGTVTPNITQLVDEPITDVIALSPTAANFNDTSNVAQFGGNNVATGVGASGTGIPRVTLAYDGVITLQASQVSGTSNATTTRTTTTGLGAYRSASILVNITNAGAATGTLQLFLEDSYDGGTTWNDLVADSTFTFGGSTTNRQYFINSQGESAAVPVRTNALTNSAVAVAAFPATLKSIACTNVNSAQDFVQVYDTTGSVTVGTTVPTDVIPVPSVATTGGGIVIPMNKGFVAGVKVAGTTTATGASAPSTALDCSFAVEARPGQGATAITETMTAGYARQGPFGDQIRVREKVSGVGGSPTGVTYVISGVFQR